MSKTVNCEICGGLYSAGHLKSHKRLAHGRKLASHASAPRSEEDAMQMILALFDGLSSKHKALLLKRLASLDPAP